MPKTNSNQTLMNGVILDGFTLNPGDISYDPIKSQLNSLKVYPRTPLTEEIIIQRISTNEVVFTNKTPLTRGVLEACPHIKYIGILATGYNNVHLETCYAQKIVVTNVRNYGSDSVAQHVLAMCLNHYNNIAINSDSVKKNDWKNSKDFCYYQSPIAQLSGKTVGIIGFGNIGQKVASLFLAFGMKVLVYSPSAKNISAPFEKTDFESTLSKSDIISLHCPLTKKTENLINSSTLSLMRENAILINSARGGLIEEEDLLKALQSRKLSHAMLDVLSEEPPTHKLDSLINSPHTTITPHIAWSSIEARENLLQLSSSNLMHYLNGTLKNNMIL